MTDYIKIRGARTHNLKNINLDIPRGKLVVITGLSGSGKSSLAFDTLYAEGQRRYVESLSSYARQFLQMMDKPDVDLIEGLSPAVSIEQKTSSHNPRSTIGTSTEIYDYLRLLFARVGVPYCPYHHQPLRSQTVSQVVDEILSWPLESKIIILAPIVINRKGEFLHLWEELRAQGFIRVKVDQQYYMIEDVPVLKKNIKHNIDVVIDRLKVRRDQRDRITESIETGLRLAEDRITVVNMENEKEHTFSTRFSCPECTYNLSELEPRLFSFNNPIGACPTCNGLGFLYYFDEKKLVVHPELSLLSGAIALWNKHNQIAYQTVISLAKHYGFDIEAAYQDLPMRVREVILYGSGKEIIDFSYDKNHHYHQRHSFEGLIPNLERRLQQSDSGLVKEEIIKYQTYAPCPECHGARLRLEARLVKVGGYAIHEITQMNLQTALAFFDDLQLKGNAAQIAEKVLLEIKNRLHFLLDVGLDYLQLSRSTETLSGGEAQRIRLASQIGSGLTGVLYVLDEPSIGLHQRDNDRLLNTLRYLRDLDNSVLVVEHDKDAIEAADFVIDIGPGAGRHGGEVVAALPPAELINCTTSLTAQYLSGQKAISYNPIRKKIDPKRVLILKGAKGNNLKDIEVTIPLGVIVCVTGVSGSGKSTLVNDTLVQILLAELNHARTDPAPYQALLGLDHLDKIINIDQAPIGRTPRSNPATYTGVFGPIRELFSQTPLSRERGYRPGRFSFNVKGGRCEACEGDGVIKVEMHFLSDIYVKCDVCHGKRYNRQTLEVYYRNKNISDVLEMTVEEAQAFFQHIPAINRRLSMLLDVGLGYIQLGQSATTLSGGEAQRIKLALELAKRDTGRTFYVLDEPTTGLHFADIDLLLKVLKRLNEKGNSILIIEHNLDVIKTADYIIDLGPEGGQKGGEVIAYGTPEEVAINSRSYTGHYLQAYLKQG
jgi:excinuclease ABC, A subunit